MSTRKLEITKEQFGAWRNHPVGLFFQQFVKDHRNAMINGGIEQWLNRPQLFAQQEAVARGRILEAALVESLSYEQIVAFYEELYPDKEEGDGDAAESSQTVSG